ncbi:MAG: DUF1614 domain-containing protein [Firmicutes bacterium]|nr:DUF1614 domain-containing protein [Candidatus Fermentithermobacillaceae bacterium]
MGLPVGTIILAVLAILIFTGVLHRVLDRMRLNDRAALAIILAMAAGSYLEFTPVRAPVTVTVNVGGAVIPLAVAIWLIATADRRDEQVRAVVALIVTGLVIWGLSKVLSPEEQWMRVSPIFVYGLAAGIVAAVSGRSRRTAFVGGLGGYVLSDILHWVELGMRRYPGTVAFGGAGAFDATVIASVLAVLFVELVGETRERLVKSQGGTGDEKER